MLGSKAIDVEASKIAADLNTASLPDGILLPITVTSDTAVTVPLLLRITGLPLGSVPDATKSAVFPPLP